jgi:hypothetical protein
VARNGREKTTIVRFELCEPLISPTREINEA